MCPRILQQGNTPLHIAAMKNTEACVADLMVANPDVMLANLVGGLRVWTCLMDELILLFSLSLLSLPRSLVRAFFPSMICSSFVILIFLSLLYGSLYLSLESVYIHIYIYIYIYIYVCVCVCVSFVLHSRLLVRTHRFIFPFE